MFYNRFEGPIDLSQIGRLVRAAAAGEALPSLPRLPSKPLALAPEKLYQIKEVADATRLGMHVLRFWEDKFPAYLKPVRSSGGRRYYRFADVLFIRGIKSLAHEHGMALRGIERVLKEKGRKHVEAIGATANLAD